jgi:hypothetical protein
VTSQISYAPSLSRLRFAHGCQHFHQWDIRPPCHETTRSLQGLAQPRTDLAPNLSRTSSRTSLESRSASLQSSTYRMHPLYVLSARRAWLLLSNHGYFCSENGNCKRSPLSGLTSQKRKLCEEKRQSHQIHLPRARAKVGDRLYVARRSKVYAW